MNKLSSIPLVTRRGFFSTGALVAFAVSRHCATAAPFVDKWDTTISAYLRDPLWEPRYAYDAGHVLLGPLYAAFTSDSDRRAQFLDHFQRFMDADKSSLATCSLNEESGRIHYLYLATHFLKLSESAGLDPPKDLRDRLIKEFIAIYRDKPVWGYDPTMYNGGIKGRVEKKLATFNSPYDTITQSSMSICSS